MGVREGNQVQILSGVTPGEEVVVVGGLGMDDKAKVKVVTTAVEESDDDEDEDQSAPPDAPAPAEREMSELSTLPPVTANRDTEHWTARHGKPIIFVILTLVAVGIYLAATIPVAVFPSTDFPRIVVGADAGVYPDRSDAGDRDQTARRSGQYGARPRSPVLDHQPRHRRNRPVLHVERGYVPDAGTGERRYWRESSPRFPPTPSSPPIV